MQAHKFKLDEIPKTGFLFIAVNEELKEINIYSTDNISKTDAARIKDSILKELETKPIEKNDLVPFLKDGGVSYTDGTWISFDLKDEDKKNIDEIWDTLSNLNPDINKSEFTFDNISTAFCLTNTLKLKIVGSFIEDLNTNTYKEDPKKQIAKLLENIYQKRE